GKTCGNTWCERLGKSYERRIGSPRWIFPSGQRLSLHDNPAPLPCSCISCRLRHEVVRIGMNDNCFANDVGCRSCSDGPVFGNYFQCTGTVFTHFEVVNVAGMEFATFRTIAMGMVHRIPVRARGCCIWRAAVAVLVLVPSMCTRLSALYFRRHLYAIVVFFKDRLPGEGASTRTLDLGC